MWPSRSITSRCLGFKTRTLEEKPVSIVPERYSGMGLTTMLQVAMAKNLFDEAGEDLEWYKD